MPTSTPGAFDLLLATFRADTDPVDWQRRAAAADPDKLVISAIVLGLAPLLHWQLSVWGVTLAPRAWAKLLSARGASAERQHAIQTQLVEILEAGAQSQLTLIVLKGAFLAAHVYPEAGLRPMNDIDILVRPAELPLIEAMLLRVWVTAATIKTRRKAQGWSNTPRRFSGPAARPAWPIRI